VVGVHVRVAHDVHQLAGAQARHLHVAVQAPRAEHTVGPRQCLPSSARNPSYSMWSGQVARLAGGCHGRCKCLYGRQGPIECGVAARAALACAMRRVSSA
jgi:hypothetical protein